MIRKHTAIAKSPGRRGGDPFVHPDARTLTGKVDKSVGKQLAALPFVRSRKRGEKGGHCWWSVTPTGN